MKKCKLSVFAILILSALLLSQVAWAGQSNDISQQLDNYQAIYTYQSIPKQELAKAKGVIIMDYAQGAAGIGFKSGDAVGMKLVDGKPGAPVFLDVTGGSIGAQLGGSTTQAVYLLMNDSAMQYISNGKTSFDGFTQATFAQDNAAASSIGGGKQPSVIIYTSSQGGELAASMGALDISPNNSMNKQVYGLYSNKIMVQTPSSIKDPAIRASAENLADTIS